MHIFIWQTGKVRPCMVYRQWNKIISTYSVLKLCAPSAIRRGHCPLVGPLNTHGSTLTKHRLDCKDHPLFHGSILVIVYPQAYDQTTISYKTSPSIVSYLPIESALELYHGDRSMEGN